jgi:hypothetical protein
MLESPAWEQRAEELDRLSSDLVDRIFWRAVLLVALIFAGTLALRLVPSRRLSIRQGE